MRDYFLNPITTKTWSNGRHLVRCVKIIQETNDVRTFCFMADQPMLFFFKPGQFVTIELEIDGQQQMRSYTISSSPSVPYSFSLTIKRVPGGKVSNWIHDHLKEGDVLPVNGPVGNFNAIDFPAEKVLFLSGGVGITPVMSMARWFFDTNGAVDMVFVHSARTPADIIYHRELRHMASRINNFKLHLVCERYEIGQTWSGYRGYLNQAMLELIAPNFMHREIFCCGPTPYMRAIKQLLQHNQFDLAHYHQEAFGPTPPEIQEEVQAFARHVEAQEIAAETGGFNIDFSESGTQIQSTYKETVRAAAARAGLHIPTACGMGICGTCKVLKTSGEVTMEHNGGITEEDEADGYILACCSIPKTDVVIAY